MTAARDMTRWFLLIVLAMVTGASSGCVGCSAGSGAPDDAAVQARFGLQSARVLGGDRPFVPSERGFAIAPTTLDQPTYPRGLRASLPALGEHPVRFEVGGLSIQVREPGAFGEGARVGAAVAYPREGGTSYWTATADGYEEWLLLDAGIATDQAPVATWEVEGATLREAGGAIEILDETGSARVRVTAPLAWAEGGRSVATRLTAEGDTIALWASAGGAAVLVDPAWVATGSMTTPRYRHTQTLLSNGKVLVTGGGNFDTGNALASAEIYDPASGTWSSTGSMIKARVAHAATLLPNGRVLVTGGQDAASVVLAAPEIYDPATGAWSAAALPVRARVAHTATLLQNGKVAVFGGFNGSFADSSIEIYDPGTGTWTFAGQTIQGRVGHTATVLPSGKILFAGGSVFSGSFVLPAELYDPFFNLWSPAGSLPGPHEQHTATLLPNGKVALAGGAVGGNAALATVDLYDPALNTWSPGKPLAGARLAHVAVMLTSGKLLVAGGFNSTTLMTTELYTFASDTWSSGPDLLDARGQAAATLLPSNKVLVSGGFDDLSIHVSAELFNLNNPSGTACAAAGECQSGFCVDGFCCNQACNAGPCDACSVAAGAALDGTCALLTGIPCNDGSACTQTDTCQAGVCTGSNPVVCAAPDQCHTSACNPLTGACASPVKPNGTACNDGNPCTLGDACQLGTCTPVAPVICAALDSCHDVGSCNPQTGGCSNPNLPDGTGCNDGTACTQTDTCQAGVCTGSNPVVCPAADACHDVSACNPANGTCSLALKPNGTACSDGNACTVGDTCQAGACVGGNPIVCVSSDQCHAAGVCNAATGVCSNPPSNNGTPCNDGNGCSQNDTCQGGACTPGAPVICSPQDACHDQGSCDPASGTCSNPNKANGTPCNDGSACTQGDTCQVGVCTGATAVLCAPSDPCHAAGACNPATGVCTNPTEADGTPCNDGNACTQKDTCVLGNCLGSDPVACVPSGECHEAGSCDPGTGACSSPVKPDGTPCSTGECVAGACSGAGTGGGSATTSSGSSTTSNGSSSATTSGGGSSTTTSGGDTTGESGGCGCSTAGSPTPSALWLGLGALLFARRPSRRRRPR